jgi:ankyrin repeat protein
MLLEAENNSVLITAAKSGDTNIVQGLLNKGVDVNAKDSNGNTVLMWAAWYGRTNIVKLLLDNGANVNAKNNFGHTTLALVKEKDVADLLKQAGAKE